MSENRPATTLKRAMVLAPEFFFVEAPENIARVVSPYSKLLGVPLVIRVLRQLQDAGVEHSVVILPIRYQSIGKYLEHDHRLAHKVVYRFIADEELNDCVRETAALFDGSAFLCRSDLIAPVSLFEDLGRALPQVGVKFAATCVSDCVAERRLMDSNGAWKLSETEKRNPTLTGVAVMSEAFIRDLQKSEGSLGQAIEDCSKTDQIAMTPIEMDDYWSQCITLKKDVRLAEKHLLATLRKPIDGLIARTINRRISIPISRVLSHTSVTPNQTTIVTLIMALVAMYWVAKGTDLFMLYGAMMLQFASIIDGVDGELARLKFTSSKLGQWLDTIIDDFSNWGFMAAVTYTVWQGLTGPEWLLGFGLVTVVSYGLVIPIQYRYILKYTDSGDVMDVDFDFNRKEKLGEANFKQRLMFGLMLVAKRDFFIFAIFVFALLGILPYFLILSAIGAAVTLLTHARHTWKKEMQLKAELSSSESKA